MKHILMWLVFGVPGLAYAQTITIEDQETGTPLEQAVLISESPSAFATTNTSGQADIRAFKGSKEIIIRILGYKTVAMSFEELRDAAYKVALTPTSLNMDEVVISATRWRQVSSDVPAKIATITRKELALQNPQTAADLLNVSGKVFVQKSQQGGGSPMIRGFATNRLLYTIDGVRMNTAIFRGGNLQNVISLDPFATEHTEVLFGPGSVIYGSDAIGGVMSFQTLTPQLSLSDDPRITGKAVTRYSSANNEKTGHFDIGIGWKKWALVSSFSSWDFDHLRQGSHGPEEYVKPYHVQRQDSIDRVVIQEDPLLQVPTAYAQINMMQKVRYRHSENLDIQYGFHYSATTPYGRYDRHNRVRNGTARYAEWNYGPQKWMMNNLSITHRGSLGFYDQLSIRLAQQTFGESRIDRSLHDDMRNTQEEEVQAYSANVDFIKVASAQNTVYYGVEYVSNEVASTGKLTDISTGTHTRGPSRYPQATWQSMAIYLNDQYKPSDKLTLQGGLRYNHVLLDARFDTSFYPFPFTTANMGNGALTGSLGAVFRPTDTWVVSSNFGTAFRSPNVDDVGKVFDSEPGTVTVPNPGLKPEYAYNIDLGIAKVFGEMVKLDLTGYYTILDEALVRRNYTLNGADSIMYDGALSQVQAIQNAAIAHVYGVQAGVEIKLPAGFSLSSDYNFQVGEEELDDGTVSPSRHAAPSFGVTRLSYTAERLYVQLYATYQSERKHEDLAQEEQGKTEIYARDANGNPYSPAWYTLNIKAMYRISDYLTVSSGLENITDQRYRPYSAGISAPGRNFLLSVKANF